MDSIDTAENQKKIPVWGWAFVALCGAIPVISIGGAIPSALGVGGAFFCLATARDGKGSEPRRILHCMLVSVACWAAFGGLVFIMIGGPKKAAPKAPPGITRTTTITDATGHSVTAKQEPVRQVSSGLTNNNTRTESTKPALGLPYPYEPIRTAHVEPSREIATINATEAKVLSAEEKQKIYAKAASWRATVANKQKEINERRREGKSTTVHQKQLDHLRSMNESHLDFASRCYKISRQEVEAIIREGDRQHWAQK